MPDQNRWSDLKTKVLLAQRQSDAHSIESSTSEVKTLQIPKDKRAKKENTGFYTCVAVNECGKNPFTMHLVVGSK